jgi:hypothetical protein
MPSIKWQKGMVRMEKLLREQFYVPSPQDLAEAKITCEDLISERNRRLDAVRIPLFKAWKERQKAAGKSLPNSLSYLLSKLLT